MTVMKLAHSYQKWLMRNIQLSWETSEICRTHSHVQQFDSSSESRAFYSSDAEHHLPPPPPPHPPCLQRLSTHVQSLPLQHMKRHIGHQGNFILSIKAGWKAMLGYNKPDLSVCRYQAAQASRRYFSWYFLSRPNCSWEVKIVYETSTESRCCRHPISNLWLTFPFETFHPKGLTFQSPPFFLCPSKFAYCKHFSSLLWWNRAKNLHNGGTRC